MQFSQKPITLMPFNELVSEYGTVYTRGAYLNKNDIKRILQAGTVYFVIANIASPLKMITVGQCFSFWKHEVESHLADDFTHINLDNYFGNYAYIASKWASEDNETFILLEKIH